MSVQDAGKRKDKHECGNSFLMFWKAILGVDFTICDRLNFPYEMEEQR